MNYTSLKDNILNHIIEEDWTSFMTSFNAFKNSFEKTIAEDTIAKSEVLFSFAEAFPYIKNTSYGYDFTYEQLLMFTKMKSILSTVKLPKEDTILAMADYIAGKAQGADDHTIGFAWGLFLYPNSDTILAALLSQVVNHNGFVEGAFEKAAQEAEPERKHLLLALDVLCSYHITGNNWKSMYSHYTFVCNNYSDFTQDNLIIALDYLDKLKQHNTALQIFALPNKNDILNINES